MSSELDLNSLPDEPSPFVRRMMEQLAKERGNEAENPWRWNPVPFREFAASPEHMNFPYMTPRQLEVTDALFPLDPKKTFSLPDKKTNLAVLTFGKGAGKDTIASISVCYILYILLCLKNPYEFITGFNIPDASLDIVNVAYNYEQANSVFFVMLKNRVRRWKWLRNNFVVKMAGKELDSKSKSEETADERDGKLVKIYPAGIVLPNMIRVFSAHSMAEGTEGKNVLCFIIDEASSLATGTDREKANGDELFNMLRTSAQSRFADLWSGFVMSFPRHQNDFQMKMYREVMEGKHPRAFASKGATWEIIPSKPYENFKAEFDNPSTRQDAETKYACNPPAQQAGFIELVDRIGACIDRSRKQAVEFETTIKKLPTGAQLVGKIISRYNVSRQPDSKKYVARVDLGSVRDRCTTSVGHLEGENVIIDMVTHWQGSPGCPVDVDDPAQILLKLRRELFNIHYISYDSWQSLSSLNTLNKAGIVSNKLSLGLEEYKLFRSCLYSKTISLLDYPLLTDPATGELAQLRIVDGVKVDHAKCFTGDTKVALMDGRNLSFVEIVDEVSKGKELWTYSIDLEQRKVVPGKITNALFTKTDDIVEVCLDNGEQIRCTKEHRFMLRDGSYCCAEDLILGQSLMPLYRNISSKGLIGYEMVYNPFTGKRTFTHRLNFSHVKRGSVVHHVDFNKNNNSPNNLIEVTVKQHREIHNRNQSPIEREKRRSSLVRYHQGLSEEQKKSRSEKLSKSVIEANLRDKRKPLNSYRRRGVNFITLIKKLLWWLSRTSVIKTGGKLPRYLMTGAERVLDHPNYLKELHKERPLWAKNSSRGITDYNNRRWSLEEEHNKMSKIMRETRAKKKWGFKTKVSLDDRKKPLNHKVVSVRLCGRENVYDLEIEKFHNFALASGVFVHNSGHNDLAEAVVGVTAMLLGMKKNYKNIEDRSEFYVGNENSDTQTIWSNDEGSLGTGDSSGMEGLRVHLR